MTTIEQKIVEILFKDKLVVEVMVEELLPMIKFTPEGQEDLTPEMTYEIARMNLRQKLVSLL